MLRTEAAAVYYDPYDEAIDRDPHPTWKRLRDEAPLYYNDRYDFFALSRYEDVLSASADWQTYSSARGTVLEMMDDRPMGPGEGPGEGMGMMIWTDPPRHDRLRKLVSRSFTPRRMAVLEERVRELCAQMLSGRHAGEEFDYLEDFGAKVPAMMIGALLGVPKDDQDQLRVWGDLLMRLDPEPTSEKVEGASKLSQYLAELARERQLRPQEDLVSDLARSEVTDEDGSVRPLSFEELMSFLLLLQVAGSETTARLLGWSAVLLHRHPDQRALLCSDASRIPNAVDELLRYEAPSPVQARWVTRDVDWHGTAVRRNSRILLLTGSAGRDERTYRDADRFDVLRKLDRHVTFGYGPHFCLGAALARLEAKVVLEETLRRFPAWEVDEDRLEFVRTSTVRGPSRVPFVPTETVP
jgi:cytochrome P450